MKYKVLGCGSSMGVPVLGCSCDICSSFSSHNKRKRTSLLINDNSNNNIVIDTSADFREQCLYYNIDAIKAVLYTHFHADHIFGIDDIRSLAIKNNINLYANSETKVLIE
ncbi:MAG: MBL fold metallo-hydrolase, partial [Anaplasmataceae bacterium]|nr:MBL fold metallo-hydrolase [Anaplasmataceae bacterium]